MCIRSGFSIPGGRRWIPACLAQSVPLQEACAVVQSQQSGGRLTDRRQGEDRDPVQIEMEVIAPSILAWIEEADQRARFRDDRSDIAPLVAIAGEAGICEIALLGRPSMLLADDVIHLTAEKRIVRADEAVFAKVVGSCRHKPAQIGGYIAQW